MKIIIFSDTHLTETFDEKEYIFLKKLISTADKVIINGDFWEGWRITFSQFIHSPWNKLFPLLKKKNTVYVYGNHDKNELSDARVSLFSVLQTEKYSFQEGSHTFIVQHGHDFALSYQKVGYTAIGRKVSKLSSIIRTQALGEKIIITLGLWKYFYKAFPYNQEMKKKITKLKDHTDIFICGHTHNLEVDLENNFINDGLIRFGLAQYILIDGDSIEAKQAFY